MSSKPPVVFPQEQTLLTALGERLRLARLRRKLSTAVVAQRAGMSRTSVYKVEAGDAGATLGTYLRVLAVLGLQADFNALAADDKVGRKLQDLALAPSPAARRQRRASVLSTDTSAPASWARAASAARSVSRRIGLQGLSAWMSRVLGLSAARVASRSDRLTGVT